MTFELLNCAAAVSVLDWSIVLIFLGLAFAFGAASGRGISSAKELFLGRQQTPWWAIGLSILASYVSALSFLGAPAWAYEVGLQSIMIHLNYPIVVLIVVSLFLPFFFASGTASIYAYLERRFGKTSRKVMAMIFLITQCLSSAALLASTAWVVSFITGFPLMACLLAVALFAVIYTLIGGITAVIWTDVLQSLVLTAGALLVLWGLFDQFRGDTLGVLSDLKAEGRTRAVNWAVDFTQATTVWAGVLAMTLYHTTVYGANQMIAQRALAARSIGDAKKAFLLAGYGAVLIYLVFASIGLLLYAWDGDTAIDNRNLLILVFARTLEIPGLMGLLAAAIIAASLSSIDSALNSLTTITTVDFLPEPDTASTDSGLGRARLLTIGWGGITLLPAMALASETGSILEWVARLGSFFVGAKLAMFGLGFFSKSVREPELLIGVGTGFVAVALTAGFTSIAWPWYVAVGAGVNVATAVLISRLLRAPATSWPPWTVSAVRAQSRRPERGWSPRPGDIEPATWGLLVLFVLIFSGLLAFEAGIP